MVELKNRKLGEPDVRAGAAPLTVVGGADAQEGVAAEAEGALVALGYRPAEAARAVADALGDADAAEEAISTQQLVRLALRRFARSAS